MRKPLTVTSINIEGLKGNAAYAAEFTNSVICLQEHWLHSYETVMFKNLFPTMDVSAKCVDDADPMPISHRTRGTAGVAVLWPKTLSPYITPLPDGSNRVVVIAVWHP